MVGKEEICTLEVRVYLGYRRAHGTYRPATLSTCILTHIYKPVSISTSVCAAGSTATFSNSKTNVICYSLALLMLYFFLDRIYRFTTSRHNIDRHPSAPCSHSHIGWIWNIDG